MICIDKHSYASFPVAKRIYNISMSLNSGRRFLYMDTDSFTLLFFFMYRKFCPIPIKAGYYWSAGEFIKVVALRLATFIKLLFCTT